MNDPGLLELGKFRFSPLWTISQFDSLSSHLRDLVRDADTGQGHFGFLVPCDSSSRDTLKAVDHQIALLLLSVREPGRLPSSLLRNGGERLNRIIGQLVLDGVLEVESQGKYVSGPVGYQSITGSHQVLENESFRESLSVRAVRHAARFPIEDPLLLSARLYFFNRSPITPRLLEKYPDEDAVAGCSWVQEAANYLSESGFSESRGKTASSQGWRFFRRLNRPALPVHPRWKLYFSPSWNATPDGLVEIAKSIHKTNALAIKFGRTIGEFLRPDKILLYFGSQWETDEACLNLASAFPDDIAQGVPFAESVAKGGLFAKGLDPEDARPLTWLPSESWRSRITNRLAVSLLHARTTKLDGIVDWEFALMRVREEGINPETWRPVETGLPL